MATFNFNLKIKVGKHTPMQITAISTAVNEKDIIFHEAPFKMTTKEMETLVEASIEKTIGAWIDKKLGI